MKIRSESAYTDGHESTVIHEVPDSEVPDNLLEVDLWGEQSVLNDFLHTYSGDGHGTDSSLGFSYEVTIIEAADKSLVGLKFENCG